MISKGNKTFYIFTYGCQMNKNDSEIMAGLLTQENNLIETKDPNEANVLIFNSCAVRQNAENRVFSRIIEFAAKRKKHKRDQIIILAGCIPQYEKENILKKYPQLDLVIGPNSFEYLTHFLSSKTNTENIHLIEQKDTKFVPPSIIRSSKDQAWIPISYGCNNFCSYCIVPYTRGREISRKKEDILDEILTLKDTVYNNIVLLGQNVNSYGQDLYKDYSFKDLLVDIAKIDHIKKIDFLTSHPKDITEDLIKTIALIPTIGKEIHFPLQAGDDEILTQMNRGYNYNYYVSLVNMIRNYIPDAKISTDLIVGFPGETEKQFNNTLKAIKELNFFRINSAAYSPRKGTKAAEMPNQLNTETKHQRLLKLQEYVKQYAFNKY